MSNNIHDIPGISLTEEGWQDKMTPRDHFAGLALPALIAARSRLPDNDWRSTAWVMSYGTDGYTKKHADGSPEIWRSNIARDAYELADAMLAERDK